MSETPANPLLNLHHQTPAEFQLWGDVEIVQTFGEPQAEYAAIHKSAGMLDLPQRGFLELTGKDRLPFLNNLLTNQTWDKSRKTGLSPGQGVYAFMLNLRGRIVADVNVLELADRTLLEMDARLIEPLRAVLEKFLFAEQVKIASRVGELHQIALHGPSAASTLGISLAAELHSATLKLDDVETIAWRDDPTGTPGFNLIVPTPSAAAIWSKLALRPLGWAAFNATRIEAGRPIFGIDFDGAPVISASPGKRDDSTADSTGSLPAETGLLNRAVSFTKGCYLGQEIVARMHARGQLARQLVGIRMEGEALPLAGAQITDPQSNTIGLITSSTVSPILSNAALCLALVKKPHYEIGTKLRIPAEGAMREGVVVKLPFLGG